MTAALIEYVSKQAVGTNEIEAPLKLSESGRTHFVDPDAIELVEAQGNYVKVHLQDGALLVHMSLSAAENMLPGEIFFRAHRSVIVPSSAVLEISRSNTGAYLAHLRNGLSVCVSRRKLTALRAAMDHISKS